MGGIQRTGRRSSGISLEVLWESWVIRYYRMLLWVIHSWRLFWVCLMHSPLILIKWFSNCRTVSLQPFRNFPRIWATRVLRKAFQGGNQRGWQEAPTITRDIGQYEFGWPWQLPHDHWQLHNNSPDQSIPPGNTGKSVDQRLYIEVDKCLSDIEGSETCNTSR